MEELILNELTIRKNQLLFDNKIYEINDLFTSNFYEYSDQLSQEYDSDLYIINEIYINRIQVYLALELFIINNNIASIYLEEAEDILYSIIMDISIKNNLNVIGEKFLFNFKNILAGHVFIFLSFIYLLFRMLIIPYTHKLVVKKDSYSIIRTPAAQNKLSRLEGLALLYENLNIHGNVYNNIFKRIRIWWVLKSWLNSYKEVSRYNKFIREKMGKECSFEIFNYYSKRIVHTLLYKQLINYSFEANPGKIFYTGNNLDRFALIEEQIAKENKTEIVCIPHGLEYGFKLPHCFIGDIFYTTSKKAEEHLTKLYNVKKFRYDELIAKKIFKVSFDKKESKNLVFFTESRDIEVNIKIIDELTVLLARENISLYIKLHPKDKKQNYIKFKDSVIFVDDLNKAISYNLCVSRKSTILLESIYNGSKAAAILINEKDKGIYYTFPSLQDQRIRVFNNILSLYEWVIKELVDK